MEKHAYKPVNFYPNFHTFANSLERGSEACDVITGLDTDDKDVSEVKPKVEKKNVLYIEIALLYFL